jgi:DNA primase
MKWRSIQELKQQISLLDYLRQHGWNPQQVRRQGRSVAGLCPLHKETRPSFVVDCQQNLFYCHGCGQGGDVVRFVELLHGWRFSQAVAHLRQQAGVGNVLMDAARFYQAQLARSPQAIEYLHRRGVRDPAVIEQMRIGYAPGRCLRSWLESLGYPQPYLRDTGLLTPSGSDTFSHRIIFPLEGNLYGRSIGWAAPHRFLPQRKGGLYDWARVRHQRKVILVEGLFDVAAMWSAGFWNTTCSLGTHLSPEQWEQLCEAGERTIFIAFDGDASGQQAAWQLAMRCASRGIRTHVISLPPGHDPNSWLGSGATSADIAKQLEDAQ